MTRDKTPTERTAGALVRPFLSGPSGGADGARGPDDQADAPVPDGALRPFLLTAGRVAGQDSIAIETQVVTTDSGRTATDSGLPQRETMSRRSKPSWWPLS